MKMLKYVVLKMGAGRDFKWFSPKQFPVELSNFLRCFESDRTSRR